MYCYYYYYYYYYYCYYYYYYYYSKVTSISAGPKWTSDRLEDS